MLDLLTSHVSATAAAETMAAEAPHDAVAAFPTAAKQQAFQKVLEMLAEHCGEAPRSWKKCKGAYRCGKLNVKLLAKRYPAVDAESDWPLVQRLQADVRDAGFQLLMAELADDAGSAKWLVLPGAEKYAALVACGTDGANHGHTTDDIIAWLQEMERDNPFVLTACGGAFVAGQFVGALKNASALAASMCKFCPDLIDGDVVESPERVAEQLEENRGFSLWWG